MALVLLDISDAFSIPTIVTGTEPETALIPASSFDLTTGQGRSDSMVWYEGYIITSDIIGDRFYVYKLSDQSLVSDIDDTISSDVHRLGLRDGSLYLVDRTDNAVDEWIVSITDAEEDTTAPTFEVDDNDADYATTVVFGGTYTVGVISDISETGTTSVIDGDDDVDTSTAGEYSVTYTVTDEAGNSTEIVETVTVSAEVITDSTAPTILTGVPASADVTTVEVSWRVTFSEDVQNVDETDFGIKRVGEANFNPDSVTQISASVYDVFGTLPEPDVYHLRLRGISDITDLSGNLRSGTGEISRQYNYIYRRSYSSRRSNRTCRQ